MSATLALMSDGGYAGVEKQAKGFHVVLNGYTVSVQAGVGNYIDPALRVSMSPLPEMTPRTLVEVAVWHADSGSWAQLSEHDTVAGFVPVAPVFEFIGWLATLEAKPTEDELIAKWRGVFA